MGHRGHVTSYIGSSSRSFAGARFHPAPPGWLSEPCYAVCAYPVLTSSEVLHFLCLMFYLNSSSYSLSVHLVYLHTAHTRQLTVGFPKANKLC